MRLMIGTALIALAFCAPALAAVQIPRQPPPRTPLAQLPKQTRPSPTPGRCTLAACINQGISQGYPQVGAVNWCNANKNGC